MLKLFQYLRNQVHRFTQKVKKIVIVSPKINLDGRYKIRELRDGLTMEELSEKFDWILKARIQDAVLGKIGDKLVWYNGIWKKGTWKDGWWCDGIWEDGVFKKGWIRRPDGKFYRSYESEDF